MAFNTHAPVAIPPTSRQAQIRQLVALGRELQVLRAGQAAGRCLAVSLQFALEAERRHGIAVVLVKWRVKGDPAYLDHWAVRLDGGRVLDLTRVQVCGAPQLVCAVHDYPASYVNRRSYPAALLLAAYVRPGATDRPRLSNRFLWACGTALLGWDLHNARRRRSLAMAAAAACEFGRFLTCFAASGLTHALRQRRSTLLRRLCAHTDFAARTLCGDLDDSGLPAARRGGAASQGSVVR